MPVLLGGAALTRNYVEDECVRSYACGRVAYARDAFDGLHLMDRRDRQRVRRLSGGDPVQTRRQVAQRVSARWARRMPGRSGRSMSLAVQAAPPPADAGCGGGRTAVLGRTHRARRIRSAVVPFVNERSLYQFQWGFRKQGRTLDDFLGWAKQELRPVMRRMLTLCRGSTDILRPQAAYGYWKAAGQGNDLIVFDTDGADRTGPLRTAAPAA